MDDAAGGHSVLVASHSARDMGSFGWKGNMCQWESRRRRGAVMVQ
jgi:hypothetical protein